MKIRSLLSILLCVLLGISGVRAADDYAFDHGPYLQALNAQGVSLVFTTTGKGFSWVEIKKQGAPDADAKAHYTSKDGLKEANNTFNAIRVSGLEPGCAYEYRICSKEITRFQPYQVDFGKEIKSPWYKLETFSLKQTKCSIFAASDIHNDPGKLEALLKLGGYEDCDAIFLVGDIVNDCSSQDALYENYIDLCVDMFAKEKPFVFVRGNHETRGPLARDFLRFIPQASGRFYGAQVIGDVFFVLLDCGESHADSEPRFAGLNDFDNYRTEQAEWLKDVLASPDFKNAKRRIVMSHFPISEIPFYNSQAGINDISSKILAMLNEAGIDLMVSGHIHRYAFHESVPGIRNYPILVGSNSSGARIDIDESGIALKVFDRDGTILLDKKL